MRKTFIKQECSLKIVIKGSIFKVGRKRSLIFNSSISCYMKQVEDLFVLPLRWMGYQTQNLVNTSEHWSLCKSFIVQIFLGQESELANILIQLFFILPIMHNIFHMLICPS